MTIELEVSCSAIIQMSFPIKSKDLGSLTILITIGESPVRKALLDLGSSIILMPFSRMKRIQNMEVRATRMKL